MDMTWGTGHDLRGAGCVGGVGHDLGGGGGGASGAGHD